jgi:hypothetical protein
VGATLDRVLLNHAAAATVQSLLTRVVASLLAPDSSPGLARSTEAAAAPRTSGPLSGGWEIEPETPR